MERSLFTGLTGLLANQTHLDLIGDNIANASTVAFKANRATFSDVLAQTLMAGIGPSGNRGGVDPLQIGRGVQLHSVDPFMVQGVLNSTGRPLDLAIEGSGFFVLDDQGQSFYTRAGLFGLDVEGYLVDSASGMRVQGASGDVQVDVNAPMPPQRTGTVTLAGNLPATVTGPTTEVLSTQAPFLEGTQAAVTGDQVGPFDLDDESGDPMSMTVRIDGGPSRTVTFDLAAFVDPDAATAEEVAAVIGDAVSEADVGVEGGVIVIRSTASGAVSSIDIDDGRGGPAALLGLATDLVRGDQFAATAASDLSDLVINSRDYAAGDRILITGSDANGRSISATFTYGTDGTTVGELVGFMDGLFDGAGVTLADDGNIQLQATREGEASLSLGIEDGPDSAGASDFESVAFEPTVEGQGPDEAVTSIDVFDERGESHTLRLTFQRQEGAVWNLDAVLPEDGGTMVDGRVAGISFAADGSLESIADPDGAVLTIDFQDAGRQSIVLDLGTAGGFAGVTQFGSATSVQAREQDGWAAGDLISLGVSEKGVVEGYYTNGKKLDLAQLSVATFNNPSALRRQGDSLYQATANSGEAVVGSPGSEGRGDLRSGALEASNVELAQEFVHMIEAQRSYQANARVIRASDELLAEAMSLSG